MPHYQALQKFDKLAQNEGVETVAHIATVIRGLHYSFMGNEPLLAQTCYIRNYTRKARHALTQKYIIIRGSRDMHQLGNMWLHFEIQTTNSQVLA